MRVLHYQKQEIPCGEYPEIHGAFSHLNYSNSSSYYCASLVVEK